MKLYLSKTLEEIPILSNIVTLLSEFYIGNLQSKLVDQNEIPEISHLYDPVREFIEYYSSGANLTLSKDRLDYIVNSLYMAKGSQRVFSLLEELLEIKLDYIYDFPIIEIIQFDNMKLTNVPQFISKITTALYYLLYYTELSIKFTHLALSLQGNLISYHSHMIVDYQVYPVELGDVILTDELQML